MNLTEAVKAAGVVGAGGAGFPTHVKLSAKAECFLVNAAECEPLIETDKYLCRTFPDRVVAAAVAVATPCWPAPVSAMRRVLPIFLANRAWPSTLLILCAPVWFRSSRLR